MKKVIHKITAICMALVVLISTMSFTMHMHYCGDTLVDSSYFTEAESCGMEMSQDQLASDCEVVKKNCCTNKQITVEGQDELKLSHELHLDQQVFLAALVITYIDQFETCEERPSAHKDYQPPPLVKAIYKLDEVYLI
jgi:hypothetical protein